MEFEIRVGDKVQARLVNGDDIAVVSEFVVQEINGDTIVGCPIGNIGPEWIVELIRRGEVTLPETLSDLAAWLVTSPSQPTRIVGPIAGTWQTSQGVKVDPADVLEWMPWAELPPEELEQPEVVVTPEETVDLPSDSSE